MSKKGDFSLILNITGPLAERLREYLGQEFPNEHRATPLVLRRALREFLERERAKKVGGQA